MDQAVILLPHLIEFLLTFPLCVCVCTRMRQRIPKTEGLTGRLVGLKAKSESYGTDLDEWSLITRRTTFSQLDTNGRSNSFF